MLGHKNKDAKGSHEALVRLTDNVHYQEGLIGGFKPHSPVARVDDRVAAT